MGGTLTIRKRGNAIFLKKEMVAKLKKIMERN